MTTNDSTKAAALTREVMHKAIGADLVDAEAVGTLLVHALADNPEDEAVLWSALFATMGDLDSARRAVDANAWHMGDVSNLVRSLAGRVAALAEVQRRLHAAYVAAALGTPPPTTPIPPVLAEPKSTVVPMRGRKRA